MSTLVVLPTALVEGFAEVWSRLEGGRWRAESTSVGRLVIWIAPDGSEEALPNRMYGMCEVQGPLVDASALPTDVSVNLPPGVRADGAALHAVGHHLVASSRDAAWTALRRVGRQGVNKARRLGCRTGVLDADAYHALASAKATRLGGPAPDLALVSTLSEIFGPDHVGVCGVWVDGLPIASVLWVRVGAYGMLVDGASDGSHWDKNPNNLAVWTAIGDLIDRGCRHIDYGFSAPDAGDLRFKAHMGGREIPLYRLQSQAR